MVVLLGPVRPAAGADDLAALRELASALRAALARPDRPPT
jgi:hypothetical protein